MVVAALESGGRAPECGRRAGQQIYSRRRCVSFARAHFPCDSFLVTGLAAFLSALASSTSAYMIFRYQIPTRCQLLDLAGFLHPSSRSDPSASSSTSFTYRRSLSTQSSAFDSKPTAVTPSVFKPSSSSLSE